MKLEDIYALCTEDSKIDQSELGRASLKRSELHNKYLKLLSKERLILKKKNEDFNKFYNEKFDFYVDGPTKEQIEKGWKFPAKGKILKAEVARYLAADDDIIRQRLDIAVQQEKVDFLTEVIKDLKTRSFDIRNAIEFQKFINGEGG